jgi:muramoyltetrapeptide carboxypeptidase
LVKAEHLKSGDRVAVVSLASTPFKEKFNRGIKFLKDYGLDVVIDEHIFDEYGYLAGSDKIRADILNEYFGDKSIKAIFSTCGGYGSGRILPYLDFDIICKNPKIFVGYSDITSLHLALNKKCGLITFYGQMVAVDLGKDENSHTLMRYLMDKTFTPMFKFDAMRPLNKGIARGKLFGGCLTLVDALIGTEFEIESKDSIFFFEEVEEHFHDIDRMLLHLKLSKKLEEFNGFLAGDMVDITQKDKKRATLTLDEIYRDYLIETNKPVISNFPSGHGEVFVPLPLGVSVELNANENYIKIIEGSVS